MDSSPDSTTIGARSNSPSPYGSQEAALDSAGISSSKDAEIKVRELKKETAEYVQIALLGIFLALTVFRSDDGRSKRATATQERPCDEKEDKPASAADNVYHADTKPEKLCDALQQFDLDHRESDKTPPNTRRNSFSSLSPYDPLLGSKGDDGTDPMFR